MGKVSKNAKTNRKAQEGSKDYVRVIKAVKTKKSSSYSFAENCSQGQGEGFLGERLIRKITN